MSNARKLYIVEVKHVMPIVATSRREAEVLAGKRRLDDQPDIDSWTPVSEAEVREHGLDDGCACYGDSRDPITAFRALNAARVER